MDIREESLSLLALAGGYSVEADDGPVAVVETPIFPPDAAEPDFLVLRVGRLRPRRPIVSVAIVEHVDPQARVVRVRGRSGDIQRLPEHLPLAL